MASPMVEGRVDPHKKAHFTLHISDAIADGEVGDYTSVKYNHKPAQTTSKRNTTLTSTSANNYKLKLEDDKPGNNKDVFIFTGQKTVPKKSYVLLFDPASQKATLEPLSATYTFNIASKNGSDISSTHSKLYPRKQKDDAPDEPAADDLFGEDTGGNGDGEPDPNNPYDFRHFLNAEKTKHGDDSEYAVSSPDHRGTGSAVNTPQFTARKPAAASSKPKATPQATPKPKKRKSPEPKRPVQKKAPAKKAPPPAVRLERRATDKAPARKAAPPPPSSKIKSAEIVHSSDESDVDADAEGEPDNASSPAQRSPSPPQRHASPESDEDEEMEDVSVQSGLEIEGESQPSNSRNGALASLGLGQSIGMGYLNSPSGGPISLASAASSVQGSPDPQTFTPNKSRSRQQADDGVIDFGDIGGGARSDDEDDAEEDVAPDDDDRDVESMHLGSPAQQTTNGGGISLAAEADAGGDVEEDEEEDPLLKEMMEGLAGGSESEESEEE